MKVKICSSELGVLFDDEAEEFSMYNMGERIMFIVTDKEGKDRKITTDKIYTVVKLGNKNPNRVSGWLSEKGKPTTWDLAARYEESLKILQDMGVDTERILFRLPGEERLPGRTMADMKTFGPMPVEEARDICRKYWRAEG